MSSGGATVPPREMGYLMRHILFALVLFAVAACDARSQQPGMSEGGKPQQRTDKDERGTEKAPLIVKPMSAPKDEKEAAREEKERKEKLALDSSLVEFTKLLVIVGALQFLVFVAQAGLFFGQLKIMRGGLTISGDAAKAARNNAEASLASVEATKRAERAYVAMSHNEGIVFIQGKNEAKYSIQVAIKNWGRTPGTVEDVRLKAVLLPSPEELPETPNYSSAQTLETAKTFLVPGAELFSTEPLGTLSGDEVMALSVRSKRLFVFGYVQYSDKFGKRHHGRYGRVFEPGREGNNLLYISRGAYNDDVEIGADQNQA